MGLHFGSKVHPFLQKNAIQFHSLVHVAQGTHCFLRPCGGRVIDFVGMGSCNPIPARWPLPPTLGEGYNSLFLEFFLEVGMGAAVYRGCVALKEWGERMKLDPIVSLGKLATRIAAGFVRVGSGENR
jgi:hypothetical protein